MTETDAVRKFCGACGRPVVPGATECAECHGVLAPVVVRVEEQRLADNDSPGELPIRGRLGVIALIGVFIAFLYAFYYIGKSHL